MRSPAGNVGECVCVTFAGGVHLLLVKQCERHCMRDEPLGDFLSIAPGTDQVPLELKDIANNQVNLGRPVRYML